jgi:hypothetical protein
VGQEQANLFACEVEENGGACSEPQMAAIFFKITASIKPHYLSAKFKKEAKPP